MGNIARAGALSRIIPRLENRKALVTGAASDIGSEASVEKLVHDAVAWLGGLDIVVTSAGVVRTGATPQLPLDVWDLVIRVNLTGTFLTLKHCLEPMRNNGSGAIV